MEQQRREEKEERRERERRGNKSPDTIAFLDEIQTCRETLFFSQYHKTIAEPLEE